MAAVSSARSTYKTYWNKYEDGVKEVAKEAMLRAFLWLYKGGSQYVGDYIKDKDKKYLNKSEKCQLNDKVQPTKMDITLLYKLMKLTCGLSDYDDPIWNTQDPSGSKSLEYTLYQIKEERNFISHEASEFTNSDLKEKLEYLQELCSFVLSEAGRLSERHFEIEKHIGEMEGGFGQIIGVTSETFGPLAREEKKQTVTGRGQCEGVCEAMYLAPLVKVEDFPVTLMDVLKCPSGSDSDPNVILVTGDAGSGKTSLSRYLNKSWVEERNDLYDTRDFDLVLLVRCCDVETSDVVQLLREDLPQTAKWCNPLTLPDLLDSLKTLWIFDGWDEKTEAATKLLDRLMKWKAASTFVVTSRPEHSSDFTTKFGDENILNVNLCGVDPTVMLENLQALGDTTRYSPQYVMKLIEDFQDLDEEIQNELQNPLKMQITLQHIEERDFDFDKGFDLTKLYLAHKKRQLESLVTKFTTGPMVANDAIRITNKWFALLCKVAFRKTRDQSASANSLQEKDINDLADMCDDLKISASECLSTFLSHTRTCPQTEHARYNFYHCTQQYFLAAFYVDSVIAESDDVSADLLRVFGASETIHAYEEKVSVRIYEVLLQVMAITNLEADKNIVGALVEIFRCVIPNDHNSSKWFEVIQRGGCSSKLVKEASKFVPSNWFVGDFTFEGASHVLKHTTPDSVTLQLDKNHNHPKLIDFLQHLSQLPVKVYLHHQLVFDKDATTDNLLKELCGEDSKCFIVGLEGCVSHQNYDLLKLPMIADYCEELRLTVKSPKNIELLCNAVNEIESLDLYHVTLEYDTPSALTVNLIFDRHLGIEDLYIVLTRR